MDGEIVERPASEYDHSTWQNALAAFFRAHGSEWNVRSRPELRIQVAATRFRVPDVTVLSKSAPIEQIIVTPPLAVFEILSPENRMSAMLEKLADYERMGIAGIWIIEPTKAVGYGYRSGNLEETTMFGLPGLGVTFTMEEIAAFID